MCERERRVVSNKGKQATSTLHKLLRLFNHCFYDSNFVKRKHLRLHLTLWHLQVEGQGGGSPSVSPPGRAEPLWQWEEPLWQWAELLWQWAELLCLEGGTATDSDD